MDKDDKKLISLGDVHIPLAEYTHDMFGSRKNFNLKDMVIIFGTLNFFHNLRQYREQYRPGV